MGCGSHLDRDVPQGSSSPSLTLPGRRSPGSPRCTACSTSLRPAAAALGERGPCQPRPQVSHSIKVSHSQPSSQPGFKQLRHLKGWNREGGREGEKGRGRRKETNECVRAFRSRASKPLIICQWIVGTWHFKEEKRSERVPDLARLGLGSGAKVFHRRSRDPDASSVLPARCAAPCQVPPNPVPRPCRQGAAEAGL